jgi:hypothetical protein
MFNLLTKFAAWGQGRKTWLNLRNSVTFMLGVPLVTNWFFGDDTRTFGEKLKDTVADIALWGLTLGTRSITRQAIMWGALKSLPHYPDMARRVVQGHRDALDSRTAAAVPFAHSTFAMDHAYALMQYARGRMEDAVSLLGAEAPMFAAKYMNR